MQANRPVALCCAKKIALLVGVPDWVEVRIYDEATNIDIEAFLMMPQLVVLSESHCLKIEINGRTEQSDFSEGYFLESSGELRKILPSYGHPELNHRWVFWRLYRDRLVSLLELVPERLFVLHSDLIHLAEPDTTRRDEKTAQPKKRQNNEHKSRTVELSTEQKDVSASELSAVILGGIECEPSEISNKNKAAKRQSNTTTGEQRKPISIIRLKQVTIQTGLSRSTIYDKLNPESPRFDPIFPKQVSLGIGSVGWLESEVIGWLESRIDSSRKNM